MQLSPPWQLRGLDFSSAPSRRKPCVLAVGQLLHRARGPAQLQLQALRALPTLQAYAQTLDEPGPWLGAFDLPFGLPRELVQQLGWPTTWPALIQHYASLQRPLIRDTFAAFCAARPIGQKFAHRRCDGPAGSSPSMKWVNPPVAYMLHAGVPALLDAGCHVPGLHTGDASRVVLEAYPGLLARQVVGRRAYKSDTRAKQTPDRRSERLRIVEQLQTGWSAWDVQLVGPATLLTQLIEDAMGDSLDAVLCLVAAAWASRQADWGRPPDSDPLEGWIVGAQPPG